MGLFNRIFGNPNRKVNIISLQRDLEILNDCAKLIENTVNPEVFFARYDLYIEKLSILSDAEKSKAVKVSGESLSQKYVKMNTEDKKIESVNSFINRMWMDTCQKAERLKTDKGKQNRYAKFYEALQSYDDKMPAQCRQYYNSLSPMKLSEIVRAQILTQKEMLQKDGYTHYEYIANKDSCSVCQSLDGKNFPLFELEPGVNAPPMCDDCRCSIAAHTDRESFDKWLNHVDEGGTTEEWNRRKNK